MVWMIWTNGSTNQQAGEARVLLQLPKRDTLECARHLQISTTNNEAEYEVVLLSLDLVKVVEAMSAVIHCNSQVIVTHINGDYKAKGERMKEYLSVVKSKMSKGFSTKFVQIPREENERVDHLAKAAFAEYTNATNQVLSFVQYAPAIDKLEVQVIPTRTDWMMPIVPYLNKGTLPEDRNASCRLKVQSSHFVMIGDVL